MVECVKNLTKEILIKFKETNENVTPAGVDSFSEDPRKKLSDEMKTLIHQTVAQGLFVCERARPDTQPMMAALCTRVKLPGQKHWNKPVRLMKCLQSTKNDVSTLDAGNGVHNVEWLTDLAFGVHPDVKSHVGGTVKFEQGHGSVMNISTKQKLNTESSTVAELVGVDQVLPLALWVPPFLKEQGHEA